MSVIERSAGLLLLPVYTAYLSPSDFGAISLITLIITVASSLSISPLKIALRRFYISFGDRKREYLFLAMTCMVLNLILFAPILYVFSKYYALSILNNIELVNLIRLFIIVYIFNSISQLLFQIFILERMAILATKINSIKAIFLLVTTSLFFILDFGIYSIPYGLIISQLCMIVLFSKHIKGKMVVNTNYKLWLRPESCG